MKRRSLDLLSVGKTILHRKRLSNEIFPGEISRASQDFFSIPGAELDENLDFSLALNHGICSAVFSSVANAISMLVAFASFRCRSSRMRSL